MRVLAFAFVLSLATATAFAQPSIDIKQLPRSEFDVQQRDFVSIAFEMTVRNPSEQAITLRRVTMKTVGRSPYVLKDDTVNVEQRIEAGGEATVTFSMWAQAKSGSSPKKSRGMVWVRGTAAFQSDGPERVTTFTDSFREPD
jgi:hypothetical protein